MKKFTPPIAERSTDDLIYISHYPDDWHPIAVKQAQEELRNRGISGLMQEKRRRELEQVHQENWAKEMAERAIRSYDILSFLGMIIHWPYTLFRDWSLKKQGYFRLHKQRLYAIQAGIVAWALLFTWVLQLAHTEQVEFQNEVNRIDNYEWERNNYSDEDFIASRKKSIEEVIETVRDNAALGKTTYLIVGQDTLPNRKVEQLRDLDMLYIRLVAVETLNNPETFDRITIKLEKNLDGHYQVPK